MFGSKLKLEHVAGLPKLKSGKITKVERADVAGFIKVNGISYRVLEVNWGENVQIDAHRNIGKMAAGALVGGLLTGGIGLIAGGAIGGRRKVEKNDMSRAVFLLEDPRNSVVKYTVYFKASAKEYQTLLKMMNR